MPKDYSYSPYEFFYDYSFSDYNYASSYVLTYRQKLTDTLYCPDRIILNKELLVLTYEPDPNDNMSFSLQNDVLGVFNACKDRIGVFGSYKFLNNEMNKVLHELYLQGIYKMAPWGTVIYNQDDQVMEYVLKALYLKNINNAL